MKYKSSKIVLSIVVISTLTNLAFAQENEKDRYIKLDKIVVTATKTPIKAEEVPATVNVIGDYDISLKPNVFDPFKAIDHLAGVETVKGGMSDTLFIRGQVPSILVNGRDMNFFTSLVSSSQSGIGSIDRIEVIKGPQAAIHGSKAVSGVVNIIRKKGDKDNPFVQIGGNYGLGDNFGQNLSFGGGYEKFGYFFDLSNSKQKRYKTPKGTIPYMEFDRRNLYTRFDYKILDEHEISFDYTYDYSKDIIGGDGYYYKRSAENYLYSFEPKYQGGFITYNGKINENFSLYSNFGISKRDYRIISGAPNYEAFHFLNKENNSLYTEDILQGEVRAIANFLDDNKLRFTTGIQYKKSTVKADGVDSYGGVEKWKESEKNLSPYAQVEFKPISQMLLLAGVRHDSYNTAGKKMKTTNPNFGISIFPFADTNYDYTTIWASYSKAFKTPSANERFLPGWLGGNPNLKPEKSKGFEVGVKQRLSDWGNLDFSYFKTDYEDMIRLVDLGSFTWLFKNEDKVTHKGFELSAEIYPTDWLILYASYINSKRDDKKLNKRLYGQPDEVLKYGVIIPDFKNFSFSMFAKQYRKFKFSNQTTHPSNNKTIIDTKVSYRLEVANNAFIEPYLAIDNLTNKRYYSFSSESGIMPKRAWNTGVNFRYNF